MAPPPVPPPTRMSSMPAVAGRRKLPVPTTRTASSSQLSRPSSRITRRDEYPATGGVTNDRVISNIGGISNSTNTQMAVNSTVLGGPAITSAIDTLRPPLPDFSTSITVAVRCRGRNDREVRENSSVVLETDGMRGKTVDLILGRGHSALKMPSAAGGNTTGDGPGRKTYMFDTVFSAAADQRSVFEGVVAGIVDEVLSGLNCTIFAYGQTGTGKTYTMAGDISSETPIPASAGIIPRVFHYLFGKLDGLSEAGVRRDRTVKCSYLELYNEELRDLLGDDIEGEGRPKLKMFDERAKGRVATVVQGLEEQYVDSAVTGIELLRSGSERRETAATGCNDRSSRSHSIFTITVMQSGGSDDQISVGKLNLVDLAGSENIQRSGAENKRAAEAGLINRSLLALGRVINSLVDGTGHVPYRESKLTRLLQDSLGGHTKTCMIATVSPAQINIDETISTLDYAFRAKNIRNAPQFNAALSKRALLRDFAAEISRLKGELSATRQRNGVYLTAAGYDQLQAQSESRRIEAAERAERVAALEGHVATKEQDVANLQKVLADLKIRLSHTEKRLGIAEEEARREAEAAAEALATATANIDSLDGSLRRRAGVEAKNRARWQRMRRAVGAGVSQVEDMVESAKAGHSSALRKFDEELGEVVKKVVNERKMNLVVQKVGDDVEVALERARRPIESSKFLDVMDDINEKAQELMNIDFQGLSKQLATSTDQMDQVVFDLKEALDPIFDKLSEKVCTEFSEVCQLAEAQQELIRGLETSLYTASEQLTALSGNTRKEIQDAITAERTRAEHQREDLLKRVTEMIETAGEVDDAELEKLSDKTDLVVNDLDTGLETAFEPLHTNAELINKGITNISSVALTLSNECSLDVEKLADSMDMRCSKVVKDIVSCYAPVVEQIGSLDQERDGTFNAIISAIGSGQDKLRFGLDQCNGALETLGVAFDYSKRDLVRASEEDEEAILAVQTAAGDALNTVADWGNSLGDVSRGVGALMQAIDQSAGTTSTNILSGGRTDNSGWEDYVPTGKTPIKQGYSPVDDGSDDNSEEGSDPAQRESDRTADEMDDRENAAPLKGSLSAAFPARSSRSVSLTEQRAGQERPTENGSSVEDIQAETISLQNTLWRDPNLIAGAGPNTFTSGTIKMVPLRESDGSTSTTGSGTPHPLRLLSTASSPDQSDMNMALSLTGTGVTAGPRRTPSLGGLLKELDMNGIVMDLRGRAGRGRPTATGSRTASTSIPGVDTYPRRTASSNQGPNPASTTTALATMGDRKRVVRTRSDFPPVTQLITGSRPLRPTNPSGSVISGPAGGPIPGTTAPAISTTGLRRKRVAGPPPVAGNPAMGGNVSGGAAFESKIKRRRVLSSVAAAPSFAEPVLGGVGGAGEGKDGLDRGRENEPLPVRPIR